MTYKDLKVGNKVNLYGNVIGYNQLRKEFRATFWKGKRAIVTHIRNLYAPPGGVTVEFQDGNDLIEATVSVGQIKKLKVKPKKVGPREVWVSFEKNGDSPYCVYGAEILMDEGFELVKMREVQDESK